MEKYPEELCTKLREIYKLIMRRIKATGKIEETDVLYIHLYKTEIEQNTNFEGVI